MSAAEVTDIAQLALWLAIVCGIVVLEIAAIAFFKIERERRERIESRAREAIIGELIDALETDVSVELPPPRGLIGRATREAIIGLIATIGGRERERLVRLLEEHGYVERVKRHLKSRNAATRARGCMILGGMLSEQANATLIERLYVDRNANVQLTAAEALAEIGTQSTMPILVQAVKYSEKSARLRLAVSRMGETAVPSLLDSLSDLDEEIVRFSLDILSDIGFVPDVTPVVGLLQHPSAEIRGRAADLLGIAGAVDLMAQIIDRTYDAVWFVRVRAIKSMQRLGVPDKIDIADAYYAALRRLLTDEAWWARHHAAETLAMSGERGREILSIFESPEALYALQLQDLHEGRV